MIAMSSASEMPARLRPFVELLPLDVSPAARRGVNPALAIVADQVTAGIRTTSELSVSAALEVLALARVEHNQDLIELFRHDARPEVADRADVGVLVKPHPDDELDCALRSRPAPDPKTVDLVVAVETDRFVTEWELIQSLPAAERGRPATKLARIVHRAGADQWDPAVGFEGNGPWRVLAAMLSSYLDGFLDPPDDYREPARTYAGETAGMQLASWVTSWWSATPPLEMFAAVLDERVANDVAVTSREFDFLLRYTDTLYTRRFTSETLELLIAAKHVVSELPRQVLQILWSIGLLDEKQRRRLAVSPDPFIEPALLVDPAEAAVLVHSALGSLHRYSGKRPWVSTVLAAPNIDDATKLEVARRSPIQNIVRAIEQADATQRAVLLNVIADDHQTVVELVAYLDSFAGHAPAVVLDAMLGLPGVLRALLVTTGAYGALRGPLRLHVGGVLAAEFGSDIEQWRVAFALLDTFHGTVRQFVVAVANLAE